LRRSMHSKVLVGGHLCPILWSATTVLLQTGCVDMVNALQSAGRRAFMPDTVECNNRVVACIDMVNALQKQ